MNSKKMYIMMILMVLLVTVTVGVFAFTTFRGRTQE